VITGMGVLVIAQRALKLIDDCLIF
jgi:hypothetical protein